MTDRAAQEKNSMADEFEEARLPEQQDTEHDLILGTAAGTSHERARTQTERDRLAIERAALQGRRDPAWQYTAAEPTVARGSAVGLYTLTAIVLLVLLVLAGVSLSRRPNPDATFTVNRVALPTAPVAGPLPTSLPPGIAPAASSGTAPSAPASPAPVSDTAPLTAPAASVPSVPATPLYAVPPASAPLPPAPGDTPNPASPDAGTTPPTVPSADSGTALGSGATPGSSSTGTAAPDGGTTAPPSSSTPVAPTISP